MSGLEGLASIIYHEKQQAGSMLCAQHALNSLLQGNYFTAPDLSSIAHSLDELESGFDNENQAGVSTNMDDTGFFSIQVLENALQVWGLSLVRWRSEEMRPFQDKPEEQQGFILNLNQHWFSLRRFGSLQANYHWFNLNSFLPTPEWVGKLYLGMVLQQAEQEGYSVFAVKSLPGLGADHSLPHCEADDIASTLPEPSSSGSTRFAAGSHMSTSRDPDSLEAAAPTGFEDEDMELQAVLQASLAGAGPTHFSLPLSRVERTAAPAAVVRPPVQTNEPELHEVEDTDGEEGVDVAEDDDEVVEIDPVAASMARTQRMLAQFQAQQHAEAEEIRAANPHHQARRGELEEDEQLARAIRESQQMHEAATGGSGGSAPHHGLANQDRVYDDDDAQLQAALKASLESMPEGFILPSTPPQSNLPLSRAQPAGQSQQNAPPPPAAAGGPSQASAEEEEDEERASAAPSSPPPGPAASVDVDEMRRRRLARFGG